MKIEESLGIVTAKGKEWSTLCDAIVEYMYDAKDGMNANPFQENANIIYLSNIISFYKYKYGSLPDGFIPDWVGYFEIHLDDKLSSKGLIIRTEAELENGKLNFTIKVKDAIGKSADDFHETLMHEFRHAYTTWIEKTKNIYLHKKHDHIIYKAAGNGFHAEKYDKTYSMVSNYGIDYLVIDEGIYSDVNKLEQIILKSFYYVDIDEINSFLQEYADQMKSLLRKYNEEVVEDINKVNRLKHDFNALTVNDKWESNILNSMRVTYYHNQYFRTYMSYVEFWKGIAQVDEEVLNEVLSNTNIKRAIRTYLGIDVTKRLVYFDGDATRVINKIAKKQLPIYEKVVYKMKRIYAQLIMNEEDSVKQNQEIKREINDSEFEQELLDLIE